MSYRNFAKQALAEKIEALEARNATLEDEMPDCAITTLSSC